MMYARSCKFIMPVILLAFLASLSAGQTIDDLDRTWHETFAALRAGHNDAAKATFEKFNRDLRLYLQKNGLGWKAEFLAGSLECQFSESRNTGAALLRNLFQTNRDLNEKGKAQIALWLKSCATVAPAENAPADLPADVIDTSAHFQNPGLHSFGKAGYLDKSEHLSGAAVSTVPTAELIARRVPVSEPQKALDIALARVPDSVGAVVDDFAVIAAQQNGVPWSECIGQCLDHYLGPLHKEFEIDSPDYMVTVYVANWVDQVDHNARTLHGPALPPGVVAYSVLEDMSLSGLAYASACGSLAHELVHLLIQRKFT